MQDLGFPVGKTPRVSDIVFFLNKGQRDMLLKDKKVIIGAKDIPSSMNITGMYIKEWGRDKVRYYASLRLRDNKRAGDEGRMFYYFDKIVKIPEGHVVNTSGVKLKKLMKMSEVLKCGF